MNSQITPLSPPADNFEAPETFTRDITIRDQTRTYLISELSDAQVSKVFNTKAANGQSDRTLLDEFPARVVSSCVRRSDGSAITFGEARAMRKPLIDALVKAVLDVHGFLGDAEQVIASSEKN